jgi:hypothetical protein
MNSEKFIEIVKDSGLYNWFRLEFADEFGGNWESKDIYNYGWYFGNSFISFREDLGVFETDKYCFTKLNLNRNVLLMILLSHGYLIEKNETDFGDGLLLLVKKRKYNNT